MENELDGEMFGSWKVVSFWGVRSGGLKYWNCVCCCGIERPVREYCLLFGKTKSCGCLTRGHLKHGHARTPSRPESATYSCWSALKKRCNNPKNSWYRRYGGRGITVCERWDKFENFLEDMGPKPDGLSIDRINNDLGYFKENCRWATSKEQNNNRNNTRRFFYKGSLRTTDELADLTGICRETLNSRIYQRKWDLEKALSTPVAPKTKRHPRG